MEFVETPIYSRSADKLLTDEEQRDVQEAIFHNPVGGVVIAGSGGLRKLRVAAQGKGKRGGARVIYYYYHSRELILLLHVYAKNDLRSFTDQQIEQLRKVVVKELGQHERGRVQ